MRGPIFISYASEDRRRAHEVKRFLESAGWTVWVDDAGIRGAAQWAGEIEQAIRQAAAMVLLLSHHAATSEWVDRELVAATERGVPIVTAELERTPLPPGMEFVLRARQRVRLDTDEGKLSGLSLQGLDDAVIRALEEKQRSQPARGRLALGGVLATLGGLMIVAGIAVFVVGLVQFANAGPGEPTSLGGFEEAQLFGIAFGTFLAGGIIASIGQALRRSARLAALRWAERSP